MTRTHIYYETRQEVRRVGTILQVYKAQYLHCDVAVKKLNRINDKKSDEAFRREAAILKGCRNPYIVNFMGVCKDEVRNLLSYCRLLCLHTKSASSICRSATNVFMCENRMLRRGRAALRGAHMDGVCIAVVHLQAGRICLVTELMDTSLMSALALPDDENKPYQYYAE